MSLYGGTFFGDVLYEGIGIKLVDYHGFVIAVALVVLVVVMYILVGISSSSFSYRHFLNRQQLEYWWTVSPICVVIGLWFPSIANLYRIDELKHPN